MKQPKDLAATRTLKLFLLVENRLLREALAGIVRKQPDFSIVGADRYAPHQWKRLSRILTVTSWLPIMPLQLPFSPLPVRFLFYRPGPENGLTRDGRGPRNFSAGGSFRSQRLPARRCLCRGYTWRDPPRRAGRGGMPPRLCQHLFQFVASQAQQGSAVLNQRVCAKLGLTPRQQQLLAFLARGLTNKEIAANLHLSEFTVKNHVHRIMRQLNADSRYAAVQTVCEGGFGAAAPQ